MSKSVHWNNSVPSPASPSIANQSTESIFATSSLDYVNSQLVAHGFVPAPGLCLDGASSKDSEQVVKCLLSLLRQRMEDMSRTEELSTKLRALSYDHERLTSMHRSATETAANAEREMNLHKSKLASTQRTLQTVEAAHKQTSLELQRTKTALQAVRTAHQIDIKKKEKEIERISDKWQKLADVQTKLSTAPAGIACANVFAIEGRRSRGPDLLDVALDESEKARSALVEDNQHLKTLVLKAVNSIQRILFQTRALVAETVEPAPTPFTTVTLFPMASATTPNQRLNTLLSDLRDTLETVSEHLAAPPPAPSSDSVSEPTASSEEVDSLRSINSRLREELGRCQDQLEAQSEEIESLLDELAEHQQQAAAHLAEISVDLGRTSENEEERERLERVQEDLEHERKKLSQAAAKFVEEKAILEAQRLRFLDEKRSWESEKQAPPLSTTPDLPPPTPPRASNPKLPKVAAARMSPRKPTFKSPKKSPMKPASLKSKFATKPGGKATTSSLNTRKVTSIGKSKPKFTLSSPGKKNVVPAFETEVIPSRLLAAPPASLLPGTFVLPPPSPRASLPSQPALPLAPIDFGDAPEASSSAAPTGQRPTTPEPPVQQAAPAKKLAFPIAKPFAQRMVHAYSPAKPSPLSRILSLADTPKGLPGLPELSDVMSDVSMDDSFEASLPKTTSTPVFTLPKEPSMSLAQELGIKDSPPEIANGGAPLQEANGPSRSQQPPIKGRVLFPESNPKAGTKGAGNTKTASAGGSAGVSARDKGKAKAAASSAAGAGGAGARASGSLEKENVGEANARRAQVVRTPVFRPPTAKEKLAEMASKSSSVSSSSGGAAGSAGKATGTTSRTTATGSGAGAGSRTSAARTGTGLPGPRRVPVNSAEAPAPGTRTRRS